MAVLWAMGRMGTTGDSHDGSGYADTGGKSTSKKHGLMQSRYRNAQGGGEFRGQEDGKSRSQVQSWPD
jgi:hypothetical protein